MTERVTAWVHGHVQGVGMRWWIRACALRLGVDGWARNTDDRRVEVVAEGSHEDLQALLDALRGGRTPGRVTAVVERWSQAQGVPPGFLER